MIPPGSININDLEYDETLTLQQLINEYDADSIPLNLPDNTNESTINTADDDNENDTEINISHMQSDETDTHSINLDRNICLNDRTTSSLRRYIENECFCHAEWNQKLIFRASLDQRHTLIWTSQCLLATYNTKRRSKRVVIVYTLILANIPL